MLLGLVLRGCLCCLEVLTTTVLIREGLVENQPKVFLRIKQDSTCTVTLQRVAFYTIDYTGELVERTLFDCKPLYKHFRLLIFN